MKRQYIRRGNTNEMNVLAQLTAMKDITKDKIERGINVHREKFEPGVTLTTLHPKRFKEILPAPIIINIEALTLRA